MSKTNYAGLDYSGPGSTVNRDPVTGIRYGIIHSNRVSHDALEAIYDNGEDLDYEAFKEEIKSQLKNAVEHIRDIQDAAAPDAADNLMEEILEKALSDFCNWSRVAGAVMENIGDIKSDDPVDAVVEKLFEALSDDLGDHYQGTGDCTRMSWEEDGYSLMIDGSGDLWVFKSPYFTYAQYCNPCAPGACYLSNELAEPVESNKCFCLGPDWFDEEVKCPYTVYSMETGKQV